MANFFAAGPLALGRTLGPVLWQLPERPSFDEHCSTISQPCSPAPPTRLGHFRHDTTTSCLHGEERLYGGGYGARSLLRRADRIGGWLDLGEDVYVCFDDHADGRAPYDAIALTDLIAT